MSEQRHNTGNGSIYHNFSRLSVIRHKSTRYKDRCKETFRNVKLYVSQNGISSLLSCTYKVFFRFNLTLILRYCGAPLRLMERTLAPLRRIINRELRVLAFDRVRKTLPQSFIVTDLLECGHEYACLTWDVFDLLNAYTENPEVRAKRHRCRPCAELLATKKPVQSVHPQAARVEVA